MFININYWGNLNAYSFSTTISTFFVCIAIFCILFLFAKFRSSKLIYCNCQDKFTFSNCNARNTFYFSDSNNEIEPNSSSNSSDKNIPNVFFNDVANQKNAILNNNGKKNSKSHKKILIVVASIFLVLTVTLTSAFFVSYNSFEAKTYRLAEKYDSEERYEYAAKQYENILEYKDSEAKYVIAIENAAKSFADDDIYVKALKFYTILSEYQNCDNEMNELKFIYVQNNKSHANATSMEYLDELILISYPASQSLYDEIFEWEITAYATASMYSSTKITESSYKKPLYVKYKTYNNNNKGEIITIRCKIIYPSGYVQVALNNHTSVHNGEQQIYWKDSLYDDLTSECPVGKVTIHFYNSENDVLIDTFTLDIIE